MGLNLGTACLAAARALRTDPNWAIIREQLGVAALDRMNAGLDSAPELRVEATAYARALRDLWLAFEAGTLEIHQRQVEKPRMRAPGANS